MKGERARLNLLPCGLATGRFKVPGLAVLETSPGMLPQRAALLDRTGAERGPWRISVISDH